MDILINHSMIEMDSSIFLVLNEHILEQDPINNHKICLIKSILYDYFNLRLKALAKTFNEKLQNNKVRSINNKNTLFQGQ